MHTSPALKELALPHTVSGSVGGQEEGSHSSDTGQEQSKPILSCSLCPHALAWDSQVYGRTHQRRTQNFEEESSNDFDESGGMLYSWETSLAPHHVTQIVSNFDGSILAAATDAGTVSLLRGSDGKVLATRQVAKTPTLLSFVPSAQGVDGDSLLIQSQPTGDDDDILSCVLVSNIQGTKLNGRPESASEAARQLKIGAVPRQVPGWSEVARVTALYSSESTLLLVGVTDQGKIVRWDWDLQQGTLIKRTPEIPLQLSNSDKDWVVDFRLGLSTQSVSQQTYVVFAAYSPGEMALAWLDPYSGHCISHIPLKIRAGQMGTFLPVPGHMSTVAVAVVTKSSANTEINVYQQVVEETMGLTVLTKPHLIFSVSVEARPWEVKLSEVLDSDVYAFEFQYLRNGRPVIMDMHPSASTLTLIGKIRYFLQVGSFDQAEATLASINGKDLDPMGSFHPSEVASSRLKNMISREKPSTENLKSCLEHLAEGALTVNTTAVETFAQACEMISDGVLEETLGQQIAVIEHVLLYIDKSIQSEPMLQTSMIQNVKTRLLDRKRAIRFLAVLSKEIDSLNLMKITSSKDLLGRLLAGKHYLLIEKLWEWEDGTAISLDDLLEKMVKLRHDIDPVSYVPILKNVLLPNLSINHELLPILLAWCCETVDDMDENQVGLSGAISLLEVVQNGVRDLRKNIHSSFATSSPFIDGLKAREEPWSVVGATCTRERNARFSRSSKLSFHQPNGPSIRKPPPTILKLEGLRAKAGKTAVRTMGKWTTSQDIDEDCVEKKLLAAKCLSRARKLGLPVNSIRLREMGSKYHLEDCILALVSSLSHKLSTHEERILFLRDQVKVFCDDIGCSFDKILHTYISGLCKDTNVTSRKLQEAASIARSCFTKESMALGTLVVVRAGILCGDSAIWLLDQAREAISWASSDLVLQSDMEEAARLLLIHSIVIKYCGKGAKELLRVENPKHAINLLEYVVHRIERVEQVHDIFHLCGAFLHLGQRDSLLSLLRLSITRNNVDLCVGVINILYKRDVNLADRVLFGSLSYIIDLLNEYCSNKSNSVEPKEVIMGATRIGRELLSIAINECRELSADIDADIDCFISGESITELHETFSRVIELQERHGIFISFGDLQLSYRLASYTVETLNEATFAFLDDDGKAFLTKVKEAERACLLLAGRNCSKKDDIWRIASTSVAVSIIPRVRAPHFFRFLNALGLLEGSSHNLACRSMLYLSSSLCKNVPDEIDVDQHLRKACDLSLASFIVRKHGLQMSTTTTLVSIVEFDTILDGFCAILAMVDDGIGDKMSRFQETVTAIVEPPNRSIAENPSTNSVDIDVYQPSLHPTWYHGDGLLLPANVVSLLKSLVDLSREQSFTSSPEFVELQHLLAEKGSNFSRFRLLNLSLGQSLISPFAGISEESADDFVVGYDRTLQSLCERSLGGAGVGMTSGVVDSELSVSFLLALPVKLAFKIYTCTIPIALKTQHYRRLHILASIGTAICEFGSGTVPVPYRSVAWSRQQKLLVQCRTLVLQSSWWIRFSDLGMDFDPGKFGMEFDTGGESDLHYVASLIPSLISTLSKIDEPQPVRAIVLSFARDFNIDPLNVLESQLEYVEHPFSLNWDQNDKRRNVSYCNAVASHIVRLLKPLDRARTLRRCVKAFELQDSPLVDYERFSALLSLYQEALLVVLEKESIDPLPFEVELDLVDRRRDALEILMSYFIGPLKSNRPDFLGFFSPFDKTFGKSGASEIQHISVLGCEQGQFDPLSPLRSLMYSENNSSLSAALAPLSSALGLPQGYVRARFLIAKFELAAQNATSFPSFESEVEPAIERLRSPNDQAVLAEWFAQQYVSNDDRLRCYEIALRSAIQNSSDIELRRRTTPGLADLETQSLETVRRLTFTKSAISDKVRVAAILRSFPAEQGTCLGRLLGELLVHFEKDNILTPEELLDILLREASLLVAEWALDSSKSLSLSQIQQLAELVNRACTALAEQHSHIDPPRTARLLASSWLFGGNCSIASTHQTKNEEPSLEESFCRLSSNQDEQIDNDSIDFVLDLSDVKKEEYPHSMYLLNSKTTRQQTSEEEPSSLKRTSDRENSEKDTQLASIRIAFVLSCTVNKHKGSGENMTPNNARTSGPATRKRLVLMSKISSTKECSNQNDTARQLGLQLLQVAFARKTFRMDALNDSFQSTRSIVDGYNTKTITYAMRHRALRAASILCPQEVLEEICSSEGYLRLSQETQDATLSRCCFGSFVAKEIEEMGLQLPHSDLPQLSNMNFPSYARTLWRHSRDTSFCPSKGRVLLLLTEMSLKADKVDCEFVGWLLKDMAKSSLPRTKLSALECISGSRHVISCKESEDCRDSLWVVVESTANAVLSEAFATMSSELPPEDVIVAVANTIHRLNRVMVLLCGAEQEAKLNQFVKVLLKLRKVSQSNVLNDCLNTALEDLRRHQISMSLTL